MTGVPARFEGEVVRRLGHGGEATVYELTRGRVLRVFHKTPDWSLARFVVPLYERLKKFDLPYSVPEIIEFGSEDGISFSLDRLIPGRALQDVLPDLRGADRLRALDAFTDASTALSVVSLEDQPYGEFLFAEARAADTWPEFLLDRLEANYEQGRGDLVEAISDVDAIVDRLRARIRALLDPPKVLVHGDFFPGNVLLDEDLRVTGLIDFGWLTVAGDAAMDIASAAIFLNVVRGHEPGDADHVYARLLATHGTALAEKIELYRGWYAIRFSPYRKDDQSLFDWCVLSLRRFGEMSA